MSTVSLGLIGVVCGLAVAAFGYVAVLPFVLKSQERLPAGYVMPILGWNKSKLGAATTFAYRYFMPVFWSVLGAILAVTTFGAQQ
ncbi:MULTISPECIES: hypothetical protein [unclassified Mesorhizobium]|uniref:hypothetical protein n=1 Tax=unclassified Mesorhizobium TaxID=325217 RepID=UPI000ACBDA9E|nr:MULTISPECIES: hypothetical protein [unclassified Mesorhizobium]